LTQARNKKIDYSVEEVMRLKFESEPVDSRDMAVVEFRKLTERKPDLKNEKDLKLLIEISKQFVKQFSIGGLVTEEPQNFSQGGMPVANEDPMAMQMDALSLGETQEEMQQAENGITLGEYINKIKDTGLGTASGAVRTTVDLVEIADDLVDLAKDNDMDLSAPLTSFVKDVGGDISDYFMSKTEDKNQAKLASELIGENFDVISAIFPALAVAKKVKKFGDVASDTSKVSKAINVRKDKKADIDYAEKIISGEKKFETRDTDSLRPYVGQRIGIARTGEGEAKAIGSVEIGEPIVVDEKTFRKMQADHLVPEGTDFDIKPGGKKYLYPVSNPERFDAPKNVGRGIVSRKILDDTDEAMEMLGDEDAIQAWKDANRLPESQRQKRNPIVQQAAQDLKDGKITGKEYRKVAKAEMPMRPITRETFPEMPTLKEIVGALTKDKSEKGIVGLNLDIPDGTRIGSRLDIPAYDNYDTWVVSLHDGTVRNGKAMGYGQTAVLDNVEFFTEGQGALNIATKKPKATIARIHGDYKNEDPEAVYKKVYDLMDDPEWTQVGMNPFRHSFFYDKATGNPVTRADQVLQVGPLVLAKGARSELSDLKKLKIKSADGKTRVFNEGGLMSRK
jgi:hypothetical protein